MFWFPVPDNLSIHFSSSPACAAAMREWLVLLEGPLELGETLAVFIKPGFELS